MKRLFKFIILIAIIVVIIVAGVFIYLNIKNSPSKEGPSSSVWLTRMDKINIDQTWVDTDEIENSSIVVNGNVVNAVSWYRSTYYSTASSNTLNNPLMMNSNLIYPSSSISSVNQYYKVYMLDYQSSYDVPKVYITSVPSSDILDNDELLNAKLQKLHRLINSYTTWTSGTEDLSYELACYNLQKYTRNSNNDTINKLLYKINSYRYNNDLDLLKLDSNLELFAMKRAVELSWIYNKTEKFSSLKPDGNSSDYLSGYRYELFSENLAYNTTSVNNVFNIWTSLNFSRDCMLNCNYKYVGIGVSQAEDGTYFWVAMYVNK